MVFHIWSTVFDQVLDLVAVTKPALEDIEGILYSEVMIQPEGDEHRFTVGRPRMIDAGDSSIVVFEY